jgi:hypothetical protein
MSKSNALETGILGLLFNATAIANIADNAATSPLTNLYASFHTADPGDAGDQTTSETTYTSYARVAVARTSGGWTVTGDTVVPVATIVFPTCTGGTETLTHFGIGTAASGAGVLLYSGTITPTLNVSTGIQPQLGTGTTITEG